MVAEIYINGIIGGDAFDQKPDDIGTTVEDVRRQFNSFTNPDSITVFINSDGGRVSEGFAIHDFLRAQGIPVTTIGSTVFSIASVILLAGDEGKRFMRPNSRALIHNPMPAWGIQSDAEGYRELANILEKEENEIISFYARKTGKDREYIRGEMSKDAIVSGETFVQMGFATGIINPENERVFKQPIQAKYIPSGEFVAMREKIINKSNNMAENKTLEQIKKLLNLSPTTEAEEVQPEPEKVAEEETKYNNFEERLTAIESLLSKETEQKELAIEAKKQSEAENKELITLINQATEQLKAQGEKIKELEEMPLVNKKETKPIPGGGESKNPFAEMIINSGVAHQFAAKLKNR